MMLLRVLFLIASIHITGLSISRAQERIITAGSALTETVCALGNCDQIIASDRTSLYPASIQQLPSIGYRTGISAEGIISLKPTMVIAEKEYVDDAVLAQLRATNIKLVIVDRKQNWDDSKKFIRQIAIALHKENEGEKLIAANESQLADAAALVKKATSAPKVLCVYNRGILKQAMLHDPLVGAVCDPEEVWQMTDEMLVAQAQWLPQYASEIPLSKARLADHDKSGTRVKLRRTDGAARVHTKTVEEMAEQKETARKTAQAADKGKMTVNA
ncbi:MAG: ABC transporter substrate-binding protein [Chryseolinea sp.]